jgi:hypothetical protein
MHRADCFPLASNNQESLPQPHVQPQMKKPTYLVSHLGSESRDVITLIFGASYLLQHRLGCAILDQSDHDNCIRALTLFSRTNFTRLNQVRNQCIKI